MPPEHSEAGDHDLTSRFKEKEREDARRRAQPSEIWLGDTVDGKHTSAEQVGCTILEHPVGNYRQA